MCRLRTSIRRTTKIPISDDFTTDKIGIQLPSVYRRQRNNCSGVSRMYNVIVLIRLSISTCGNGLSQVILTLSTLGQTVSRSCLAAAGWKGVGVADGCYWSGLRFERPNVIGR